MSAPTRDPRVTYELRRIPKAAPRVNMAVRVAGVGEVACVFFPRLPTAERAQKVALEEARPHLGRAAVRRA